MIIAFVTYRGYYPPLYHSHAHLPYAPRELADGEASDADGLPLHHNGSNAVGGYERFRDEGDGESVVARPSSSD